MLGLQELLQPSLAPCSPRPIVIGLTDLGADQLSSQAGALTAGPPVVQVPGSEAMLEAMSGADKVLNKVIRVTGFGKKIMSGFGEPEVSMAVPAFSNAFFICFGKES